MIHLTDEAVQALQMALAGNTRAVGIRVMVQTGGCAGLQYMIGLVDDVDPDDVAQSCGDVTLYVENGSVEWLTGATIDFVSDTEGAGFRFDNPNAGHLCSCGKSFA